MSSPSTTTTPPTGQPLLPDATPSTYYDGRECATGVVCQQVDATRPVDACPDSECTADVAPCSEASYSPFPPPEKSAFAIAQQGGVGVPVDEVFTMQSEVDPSRTLNLALPPYDSLCELFMTKQFVKRFVGISVSLPLGDVVIFFLTELISHPSTYHLATAITALEVLVMMVLFTSMQILISRRTMKMMRTGKVRGIRMSALNDTWWKRIFFFFADTKTLMRKWPLAVLNSLIIPGIPIALYNILGCQFLGSGLRECESSAVGEVLFGMSWKLLAVWYIVPPHFASCCNVEHVWNQVDGLEILAEEERAQRSASHA